MNRTIQNQKPPAVTMDPRESLGQIRRLLVLIPDVDNDLTPVASRAWEIARESGARVKFLSLFDEVNREPGLRRKLATLSALVTDGRVSGEAEVIRGRDWLQAVRSCWKAGDMLVCLAGQRTGVLQKPLSQVLGSNLNVPLTILTDSVTPPRRSKGFSQLAVWSGLLGIVAGFCLLQVRIYANAGEWATALILVSLAMEYGLIWLWNSLFQ